MTAKPPDQIVAALLVGLDFRPEDVTQAADRALRRVAADLATLEALDLDVLRNVRKLYEGTRPESEFLLISRIPLYYPDFARVWRKTEARRLRAERERLERHALYDGDREPASAG